MKKNGKRLQKLQKKALELKPDFFRSTKDVEICSKETFLIRVYYHKVEGSLIVISSPFYLHPSPFTNH